MPRYMIPPATLVIALAAVLGILYALPAPAAAAHDPHHQLELILRLLSGHV
ncbi:MAG: hypothetical protein ACREP1_00810 [Rhodanobacteraceae bacterium]